MRNPNRVYNFCNELARIWAENYPDLRFIQVVNLVYMEANKREIDPYYLEEEEMLELIKNALKKKG